MIDYKSQTTAGFSPETSYQFFHSAHPPNPTSDPSQPLLDTSTRAYPQINASSSHTPDASHHNVMQGSSHNRQQPAHAYLKTISPTARNDFLGSTGNPYMSADRAGPSFAGGGDPPGFLSCMPFFYPKWSSSEFDGGQSAFSRFGGIGGDGVGDVSALLESLRLNKPTGTGGGRGNASRRKKLQMTQVRTSVRNQSQESDP